jgi:hypothetical protein
MMGPILLGAVVALLLVALIVRVGRRSTSDGPARLAAVAVRCLPADRREWGAAMTAELGQLRGLRRRWSFALGCARAALLPPRDPFPVPAVAAIAVSAAAASLLLGWAEPVMRPFLVTLLAAAGVAATVTLARSRRLRPPGLPATLAVASGATASAAVTLYLLARYPTGHDPVHTAATDGRTAPLLIAGAVLLVGYVWLTLTPPAALAGRRAVTAGTVAAVVYSAGFVPASMFLAETALLYYLLAPVVLFGAAAARGGAVAAFWAGLISALLTFAVPVLVHFGGYQLEALRLDDIDDGKVPHPDLWFPSLLGQDLGSGFFGLVWLPLWGLLLGLVASRVFRRAATV